MATEFPQRPNPYPLGLRGTALRPGNLAHRALVTPPPRRATPRTTPWHRTVASTFNQQGSSCTAQAAIGVLTTLPYRYQFQPDRFRYDTEAERHQLYLDAQHHDPWEGGEPEYEGSSTDAPFFVLRERGIISGWDWLFGEEELWEWVSFYGPAAVGTVWTSDMSFPDSRGYIEPTGIEVGGHAYEICYASHERQAYRKIGSWWMWGDQGRAWIPRPAMRYLLAQEGEAVTIRMPRLT